MISPDAHLDPSVVLGANVSVGAGAVIESGVILGNNVTVYPGTRIGAETRVFENAVLGRPPLVAGIIDRKPSPHLAPLVIGTRCVVGASVVLYTGSRIGNNVLICDLTSIREECRIGNDTVLGRSVLLNYNIVIGDRCRIMDGCHFGGDMLLEDDVFLSPHVCSANDNSFGLANAQDVVRQGPVIRRGAIVGTNSTLLARVEIGEKAVIGAGSLVTRSVPAGKLAYGVPARVVKDVAF